VELERRPLVAEADHVAVFEDDIRRHALTVEERAVLAVEVLEDEPVGTPRDGDVPGRDGRDRASASKRYVRQRMASDPDVRFGPNASTWPARAPERNS